MAFESMQSRAHQNYRKKGWKSLKLDMSKAYDRVEWSFLQSTMQMGFGNRWIILVMEYIGTPRLLVVLNRNPKGNIIPSRGLRQGCPLSPYLFLLCAEGFSSLPNEAERWGNLMGFACRCTSSLVSYLLFY